LAASNLAQLATAIVRLDNSLNIVELNPAAEQLLGHSARQLYGTPLMQWLQGDLNESLLKHMLSQQQSGFLQETELLIGEHSQLANSVILTPLFDDKATGASGLLIEIQCSLHHQHIVQEIQLERQNRISNSLLRNLAHEIKNPLGGIKGAAQLLQKKLPDAQKYCQVIVREAERLSQLLERMLTPAQPENKQWLSPHQIIEEALQVFELQKPSWVRIHRDYDPSLPEMPLAANQLQQVLLNLLSNALDALSEKQDLQPPQITLRTRIKLQHPIAQRQHRKVLLIAVIDNGVGVPADMQQDIFFPTISSKQSTGLGLSISQSLILQHKGLIELDAKPGETCFNILLPVDSEHES